ncbi:MAG: hypothetical protein VYE77_06080 [Planctomycetota bacterium]|nr:hypothetical protein [Planctomycetota bacterium]
MLRRLSGTQVYGLMVQGFVSDSNLSAFPGFAATSGGTIVLP